MSFKIEGIESLDRTISGMNKDLKAIPAQIVKVLSTVRNQMVFDTTSGIDVNGNPFKPYAKSYQKWRLENNRQASPPSLTWKGDMLKSMKAFRISKGGEIRFDSSRENTLAVRHNTGDGVPKREFFGLNQKNEEYIEKKIFGSVKI